MNIFTKAWSRITEDFAEALAELRSSRHDSFIM